MAGVHLGGNKPPAAQDTSFLKPDGSVSDYGLSQMYKNAYASGGTVGSNWGSTGQPNPFGQFNTQSTYNNFASPNQNFMPYPQQGQPNQPQPGAPSAPPPVLSQSLPSTTAMNGPDAGGDYAGANMGFDNSGSDGGVGGNPVNGMQTPLQQGNKPVGMAQFMSPQGLQIQGNPTSQVVNRGSRT